MIKPGEIQQKANAVGVRDQQIEKDYILSWILFGISKHEQLSKTIVFKDNKRVKVDISRSEQLVFEPVMNDVFIGYSDLEEHQLLCYPLEEVLVEKMRSVMQRMQARDFYDIWYLLEEHEMDAEFYVSEFEAKCKSKDLLYTDFQKKLDERLPQYKGRWKSSMNEQIKDLPDFDQVEREVQRHLKKLKF